MIRRGVLACVLLAACVAAAAQTTEYSAEWCRNLPRPQYAHLTRVLRDQEWFEIYRVAPSVYALYEPHQAEEVISFLIVGQKRALLFDSGMGIAPIRPVVRKLTTLPVVVVNSHTHSDHVGGNHEFEDVRGLDLPYSRAHARGFSHSEVAEEVLPANLCGARRAGFVPAKYAIEPWRITSVLREGSLLDLGGRVLEVIALPGHTPDSVGLLDRRNGLMFVGDTYYAGPIWLFAPETDWSAYLRSVARLARLAPSLQHVFPAHNVPLADPAALLALQKATAAIESGAAKPARLPDGRRRYDFSGFSILLR
jgi:glyoxylase-like metal-dependent hydrolase (beta-lactamase superfamily II)